MGSGSRDMGCRDSWKQEGGTRGHGAPGSGDSGIWEHGNMGPGDVGTQGLVGMRGYRDVETWNAKTWKHETYRGTP